jgi:hypothetical protein
MPTRLDGSPLRYCERCLLRLGSVTYTRFATTVIVFRGAPISVCDECKSAFDRGIFHYAAISAVTGWHLWLTVKGEKLVEDGGQKGRPPTDAEYELAR